MKFRMALALSMVLHASLFLMVMIVPEMDTANGTTYYVDLIRLSGYEPDIDIVGGKL